MSLFGPGRKKRQQPQEDTAEESYLDNYDDDLYGNDYGDVEPDNSRWELETADVLERYEHSLKAEQKNDKGEWIIPLGAKPKLNNTGVFDTVSDLKSIMHKGTSLGNVSPGYCMDETKAEGKAYMRKLLFNMEKWEVDKTQFESLVLQQARMVHFALTRPVNDKERLHRNKRYPMKEVYTHDEVRPDEIKL